jgi:hypothetical protein
MIDPPSLPVILVIYTIQGIALGADDITLPLGITAESHQLQTRHDREHNYSPHRKIFKK